ncbi:MAG: N-acetyltransferase [Candidatus Eremiobacteraeota bacterium]|nr:N-acetyltransferase [Candidatus Eremiobacteraeota bacterium]
MDATAFVHETALVEDGATIGAGSRIWHQAQVRTRARIGERCIVGKGAFVDFDVAIGDDSKLQNYACVYHGVTLGRGVFVGPHAVFTNDRRPRATDPAFEPLGDGDWDVGETIVDDGAAIGANATILPGMHIGRWAMVGAGAVVTHDVPAYALVVGTPARRLAWVCSCGARLDDDATSCARCGDLPSDHPLRSGRRGPPIPPGPALAGPSANSSG